MFFAGSRARGSRIREEGTLLPLRSTLNFIGSDITAADNAAAGRTDITLVGGGGAGGGLPVFNVQADYGAVGDGTTDDTAAIQAAITAAEAETYFATVFLPFGYYLISSPLVITRPIKLLGEGCVVGDRLKNNNYAAKGAVIWNASTTGNAVEFRPTVVSGLWPRGLGGMIFQDFGIDTPELGGAAVTTYDPAGWGPLSSGRGIACFPGTSPNKLPYYCQYRNVTICRHAIGFDPNATGTPNAYYSGSHDFEWCNALVCRTKGYNLRAVESRLLFCRAKNNDPEWASADANPARGDYGFYLAADGSFLQNCIAICCNRGFFGEAMSDDSRGHHIIAGCGADSCPSGYDFSGVYDPVQIATCWNSNIYYNPGGVAPPSNDYAFRIWAQGELVGCKNYFGQYGFEANGGTVTGGLFAGSGDALGDAIIQGVRCGTLTRGSSYSGSIMGCRASSIAGPAGTSKGRGNAGVADWG